MMPAYVRRLIFTTFISLAAGIALQAQTLDRGMPAQSKSAQDDPLVGPKKSQKPGKMESPYRKWRDDDVADIITSEELAAFNKLSNDAERDNFVEAFWRRRDPTPDTEENEFKEEYYRRIAYADEHFGAGARGSKTDRGRIYILHGPPDSIDAHPMGGPYQRTAEEGGGQTSTFPFEIWRYRNLDHIGQEVEIEFVDTCGCGAYHITLDPGEKDALSHVPGAGLTDSEILGRSSKADRGRNGFNTSGASLFGNNPTKQFDAMERNALVLAPPPVKYKDLKEVVDVKMRYNLLPFDARIDFLKGSPDTALVPITIQVANRDLTYANKDGVQHASVNIYGRVTTLGGKIVNTFEDPLRLDIPAELFEKLSGNISLYQQALPLRPGRYRLDLVLKDVNGNKLGMLYQSINVPDFSKDGDLTSSSLVLADLIEPVLARDTGSGTFVISPDRVRPRVPPSNGGPAVFNRGEKINLWMQVYNVTTDTKQPTATVKCQVVNVTTHQSVYSHEISDFVPNASNGGTLKEMLSPGTLEPGTYQVTVTVNDLISKQTITPTAKFVVK
ncbi:MAG TPA: GWxTD domain-containing protein [Candidatus Angelobacter sp.]|jgi:GWxTD domain-containing protein